jgi:hypothetical protein
MLYCLLRLNKKYQWEPVYTEPAEERASLRDNYLTDDKDWIEKFKHEMSLAYPTETYVIAEVHVPNVGPFGKF